jgi:membrane protein DedA with SNARE-associated domain
MSLIDDLITWYSVHMNYASITGLMAVESSFIPFPSEVVIPPAAFVAGQPESVLCATGNYPVDVLLIVLFGTLGAMIGAVINYVLSVWLGRIIIYKFADSRLGHMCLLSSEKLERA